MLDRNILLKKNELQIEKWFNAGRFYTVTITTTWLVILRVVKHCDYVAANEFSFYWFHKPLMA